MKSLGNKKPLILTIFVLVAALTLVVIFLTMKSSSDTPTGMRQVKSYDPNGICQAINNPECGYCPNEPVDGKCYVKNGELKQYR